MALELLPNLSGHSELAARTTFHILRGGVVVLSGPSGSGRTVFCEKIMASLEDKLSGTAYVEACTLASVDEVFKLILMQLAPESLARDSALSSSLSPLEQLLEALSNHELEPNAKAPLRLIVLDDADCLSPKFWQGLKRFIKSIGAKHQLALLATSHNSCASHLLAPLDELKLKILNLEMPELSPQDCVMVENAMYQYELNNLASSIGAKGPEANSKLHGVEYFTAGEWTFGRIHTLVEKMLPHKQNKTETTDLDEEEMNKQKNKLLWLLGFCVTVLAAGLVYCVFMYVRYVEQKVPETSASTLTVKAKANNATTIDEAKTEDKVVDKLPPALTEENVVVKSPDDKVGTQIVVDGEALKSIEQGEAPKTTPTKNVGPKTQESATSSEPQVKNKVQTKTKTSNSEPNLAKDDASLKGTYDLQTKEVVEVAPVQALGDPKAPALTELNGKEDSSSLSVKPNEAKADSNATTKTTKPQAVKSETAKSESVSATKNVAKVDFASLDGKSYVIQIIATPSQKDALSTAAKISGHPTWVLKRTRGDYIAVVGSFKNYTVAKNAIAAFPATIKKAGPWPKLVSKVRQDLNQ